MFLLNRETGLTCTSKDIKILVRWHHNVVNIGYCGAPLNPSWLRNIPDNSMIIIINSPGKIILENCVFIEIIGFDRQ